MKHTDLNFIKKYRQPEFEINPWIYSRWSPRALNGESISHEELMALFEAARWAPSAFNSQPWRFVYAVRENKEWQKFVDLLVEFNQSWASQAAALVAILSQNNFERNGKPNVSHSFDAGAAWQNLALEAASRGLVAHAMGGFDQDKARQELKVPVDYTIEAMVAIGRLGKKEDLPEEMKSTEEPSDRLPLSELVKENIFV